jgi:hypothetical protein
MKDRLVETVVTALLLGILGAAWGTYNEVKLLRFEMNQISKDLAELRGDSDRLWAEVSDQVQELSKTPKKRE